CSHIRIHCFLTLLLFFFCNDSAPPQIYTLSLHDALPILSGFRSRARLNPSGPGVVSPTMVTSAPASIVRSPARLPWLSSRMSNRSEEHTSELQSRGHLVCRLLLEKKKQTFKLTHNTR